MKRNLNTVIPDMFGKELKFATGEVNPETRLPEVETRTLLHQIIVSLGYETQNEKAPEGKAIDGLYKIEKFELALRLRPFLGKDEEVDLSDRDVSIIKAAVDAKGFSTNVHAPILLALQAK